jgi:hypothetical protein
MRCLQSRVLAAVVVPLLFRPHRSPSAHSVQGEVRIGPIPVEQPVSTTRLPQRCVDGASPARRQGPGGSHSRADGVPIFSPGRLHARALGTLIGGGRGHFTVVAPIHDRTQTTTRHTLRQAADGARQPGRPRSGTRTSPAGVHSRHPPADFSRTKIPASPFTRPLHRFVHLVGVTELHRPSLSFQSNRATNRRPVHRAEETPASAVQLPPFAVVIEDG